MSHKILDFLSSVVNPAHLGGDVSKVYPSIYCYDHNFSIMRLLLLLTTFTVIESAVLDPSLYLSPSPPLSTTHENVPENIWSEIIAARMQKRDDGIRKSAESMEGAETFWPSYPTRLRGIHIPLTYHLTGTYGGTYNPISSVIASSYISHGIASLRGDPAGNGYKSPGGGLRIFASKLGPAWSGWGNGKWGHYAKG